MVDRHPVRSTKKMYCRGCGYDLQGQTPEACRCPECGRVFDPARPETFRRHPPGLAARRWARRAAVSLLAVVLAMACAWGCAWVWFYPGWKADQAALANSGGLAVYESAGGETLASLLGPGSWVLYRATSVTVPAPVTNAKLDHLKDIKGLRLLSLMDTSVTDASLEHLKELKGLRSLYLENTNVTGAGLVHLKDLENLQEISLVGAKVTDGGLIHVKDIKGLRVLNLGYTHVTDVGLVHLRDNKELYILGLEGTDVTDAGVKELQSRLPKNAISR